MVNQVDGSRSIELQAEVSRLKEELQMRDQLVQQLSQELFRLVKGNTALVLPSAEVENHHQSQVQALQAQLIEVEQQVGFYQQQISDRDQELQDLRSSVLELTDRSRMLEQVIQDLPGVYRQKFAERMDAVKEKVEMLQRENRQLHAELQSVSYRLAMKSRRSNDLDLPNFNDSGNKLEMPSFGNA